MKVQLAKEQRRGKDDIDDAKVKEPSSDGEQSDIDVSNLVKIAKKLVNFTHEEKAIIKPSTQKLMEWEFIVGLRTSWKRQTKTVIQGVATST